MPTAPSPPRLRHRGELALFLAVRGLVRALPLAAARPLGAALGELIWALGIRRRTVASNLELVLPELPPRERARIARRCYRHFGAMTCDTIALSRLDAVGLCKRLTLVGWDHLAAADALGRGVLVLSAHLGNWEVAARPVGLYRGPFHVVVRPFNNPLVYRYMDAERARWNERQIAKRGAAKQLFRVLREGGKAGVVMDQRVRPGQGIVLPFLGHPALVTPLPASVALRTGAPAVTIVAWPEPGGRYRVEIGEPMLPSDAEGSENRGDEAVAALTARYLAALEGDIRKRPEQWLWMHRRWRLD
ncbi:MAG TPA: lysophospholipid acyltransferase family protein [Thermoanaerobaculia bacterium]|jgi:KDO2-lipid IV(A) lauroyltransferase|nr:lysophospholipid acyltransferase family protein [Thermoanaerobaculia bacterium]